MLTGPRAEWHGDPLAQGLPVQLRLNECPDSTRPVEEPSKGGWAWERDGGARGMEDGRVGRKKEIKVRNICLLQLAFYPTAPCGGPQAGGGKSVDYDQWICK